MSRLWNKLQAQVWPAPHACIGIELAGERLIAIHTELMGAVWNVTHVVEEYLPFVPFRGAPRAEETSALAQALERLAGSQHQTQLPIQFALPDPAAMYQVLEFESIPGAVHERNALARFRLEKEWPAAVNMECVTQPLGEDQGRALLLVMAVDRAWLGCLRTACRVAGLVPSVVDMTMCHVFNRLQERLGDDARDGVGTTPGTGEVDRVGNTRSRPRRELAVEEASGGALLVIEPHAWTLLLWDNAIRPRFVRTRWREAASGQAPDYEAIAIEVERLVRAYVLAAPGRNVSGLYVCAADADLAPLAACLDTRMRTPCVRLSLGQGLSFAPGVEEGALSPGALASAILRT